MPANDGTYGVQPAGHRLPAGTRIGRVVLQVSDLERSRAFYEHTLGFHVTVVDEMSVPELLWLFPRVYRGTHISHPKTTAYVGKSVSITFPADNHPAPVFADGEVVGAGSISARVAPDVLRVLVPWLP